LTYLVCIKPTIPFSESKTQTQLHMANDPHTKRLLWFVFAGSRGGLNRLRIISTIKQKPLNTNQLAKELHSARYQSD